MSDLVYTLTVIAISVTLSTIINVLIMREVAKMAAVEVEKMEKRWVQLLKKLMER